ncbi:hypothetical protein K438DRAFT_1879765 [Mycena galopus ATCC 62051]|nr:hypothetical protein K438DRAFT_1879765 [Mycena galopus ATCC 62051]
MGVFEFYCSFWRRMAPKDGEWNNPPGYPVPSKSKEEIICISPEDGSFWNDWVCVGPKWKGDWVSPPCEQGEYGAIIIDGSSDWQGDDPGRYLRIHRGCLSFLCRHLCITPKLFWESLYQPGSDYLRYGEGEIGLLYCLKYYDMDGRNGQEFGYAVTQQTPREDDPDCSTAGTPGFHGGYSVDSEPPDLFDILRLLNLATNTPLEPSSNTQCMQVFGVPELLNLVNRFFHAAIIHHRQGLFLLLASQYGWMLPSTPADWKEWRDRSGPGFDLRLDQPLDWRAYLLTFLRKEDRLSKSWRFHRMAVQCARGRARPATEASPAWRWSVELGLPSTWSRPVVE